MKTFRSQIMGSKASRATHLRLVYDADANEGEPLSVDERAKHRAKHEVRACRLIANLRNNGHSLDAIALRLRGIVPVPGDIERKDSWSPEFVKAIANRDIFTGSHAS